MEKMSKEAKGEAGAAGPAVSKAGASLTSAQVDEIIEKRRQRVTMEKDLLEGLSMDELARLREETVQREDEAMLEDLRRDKKFWYEMVRKDLSMRDPFEARLTAFCKYLSRHPFVNITHEQASRQMLIWMETFGLQVTDRKHVMSDRELDAFYVRTRDAGLRPPFDLWATRAMSTSLGLDPMHVRRRELAKKIIEQKE